MADKILVNEYFPFSVMYQTSEKMSAVDLVEWLDQNTTDRWSWDMVDDDTGRRYTAFSFVEGKDAMKFKLTMIGK